VLFQQQPERTLSSVDYTQSEPCIVFGTESSLDDQEENEEVECRLQGDDLSKASKDYVKIIVEDADTWAEIMHAARGKLSGKLTLLVQGGEIVNDQLIIPAFAGLTWAKVVGYDNNNNRRHLPELASKKLKVLAVRVTDSNGKSPTVDAAKMSDALFGTDGDKVNLKERLESCSHGFFQVEPFDGKTKSGVSISNGVYELTIKFAVKNEINEKVQDDAIKELEKKLGNLEEQFDRVMLAIPEGSKSETEHLGKEWIAFARVNYFVSSYNDDNIIWPKVQMHEVGKCRANALLELINLGVRMDSYISGFGCYYNLGHSLGLEHSKEGDEMYGDGTGAMANGLGKDSTKMCYNVAHSWSLGWYLEKRIALDLSKRGIFEGSLVGIDDYDQTLTDTDFVAIRIENGLTDYFLGFNVAKGINEDTAEYKGEVLLIEQEGTDHTMLIKTFKEAGKYEISNYQGLGKKLKIKVLNIDLDANPPKADVRIHLHECGPGVCDETCNMCCNDSQCDQGAPCVVGTCVVDSGVCEYDTTDCPGNFVFTVKTDDWPDETSFALIDNCNGDVVLSGGDYPKKGRTYVDETLLRNSHYTLKVFDRLGDGNCCDMGRGSYTAMLDGLTIFEGGDFGLVDIHTFSNLPSGVSSFSCLEEVPAVEEEAAQLGLLSAAEVTTTDATSAPIMAAINVPAPAPLAPTMAPVAPTMAPVAPTIAPVSGANTALPVAPMIANDPTGTSDAAFPPSGQPIGSPVVPPPITSSEGQQTIAPSSQEDEEADDDVVDNDDDVLNKVQDVVDDNMTIIIGSAAGAGGCLMLCLFGFCAYRIRSRRREGTRVAAYQAVPTNIRKSPVGGYNATYTSGAKKPPPSKPKRGNGGRRGRN
jgi:hypothetical protein